MTTNIKNETPVLKDPDGNTANTPETVIIERVKHLSSHTEISLEDGRNLTMRPFIYLAQGDRLEFIPSVEQSRQVNKLIIEKATGTERKVKLNPPYSKSEVICIAPHKFKVVFRERISISDWRSAKILEQFHYRGKGLNKIVGRRTVILAWSQYHGIIGYGVLAATVAAAKPRFMLFDTDFAKQMRSKLINQLVRIPRIVVHPEFRGMGLGVLIAKHLIQYAKEYWDIQGYSPIAIEVIASMTDYHNFFEKAGFVKVGYTLGYKNGILPEYGKGSWERRPNYKAYDFFEHQGAKPYLIYPLTKEVAQKLRRKDLIQSTTKVTLHGRVKPIEPIHFINVSAAYKTSNGLTSRAQEIKEAFDVDAAQMISPVIKDFSLDISPGETILLTGASGSGKSTLTKILTQPLKQIKSIIDISGEISGINHKEITALSFDWDDSIPLIDQVGKSTNEAIFLLNGVGLAEAHLYLKRPSQISDGQRYRFAVARLCDSKKSLWVADDFACTLDPLTAAIVAKGLRKMSKKLGATLVIAAPHVEHFLGSLLPNKMIILKWGGSARIYSVKVSSALKADNMNITVTNNGIEQLSNVSLNGVKKTGISKELQSISALSRGKHSDEVTIPLVDIRKYSAIVAATDEGVGDTIYIEL